MISKRALKRYIDRRIIKAIRHLDDDSGRTEIYQAKLNAQALQSKIEQLPWDSIRKIRIGTVVGLLKDAVKNIDLGLTGTSRKEGMRAAQILTEVEGDNVSSNFVQKIRKLILIGVSKLKDSRIPRNLW